MYLARGTPQDDISQLHAALNNSLGTIAHDPSLDPILLAEESRKLEELCDDYQMPTKLSTSHRHRSPGRLSTPISHRQGRSPLGSVRRGIRK